MRSNKSAGMQKTIAAAAALAVVAISISLIAMLWMTTSNTSGYAVNDDSATACSVNRIPIISEKVVQQPLSVDAVENDTALDTNLMDQPVSAGKGEKTIYLTFDDGPSSPITDRILDVLKEKNVNGTFFVIGNKIRARQKLVERIYEEGNAIGLHTFTHDYGKIYRSHDAFLEELEESSDAIFAVLGIRPKIVRFPTGSKGHLNRALYDKLNERGYKIYDWNARITDGVHPGFTPDKFIKEAAKSGLKWNTVFMLMHCDELNSNTCKALPQIIDFFKDNNYTFKIIDENTPEYFFRFEKRNPKDLDKK